MTEILKAKPVIKNIYSRIKNEIEEKNISLKLVIILVGDDPAAKYYVQNLEKKGSKIGIEVETIKFSSHISPKELLNEINLLNNNETVHGIMIQKPLPKNFDEYKINFSINPNKDVDAFHPINLGNLLLGNESFVPCTPAAVIEMIKYYNIRISGENVVILGRSNIVGKPLANLLLKKSEIGNATVTVCHSRTKNLKDLTKNADILIAAIGKPKFVKAEMIKKNAIIIDVGVNQIEDSEKGLIYVGDVDYEDCFDKASAITPVPGGVGSVTTAMLLNNVLFAYKKLKKII
jgi:methylenetetrahydrofolate dehydrogenase (NADP+)/methenyltetrahydrofolate cyclohydrolase